MIRPIWTPCEGSLAPPAALPWLTRWGRRACSCCGRHYYVEMLVDGAVPAHDRLDDIAMYNARCAEEAAS